tara:strand:- start:1016 stop:1555 length:540 start_codon:yes stop_codon:yes gene_type:complete
LNKDQDMPVQNKDSIKSLTEEEYDSLGLEDSIKYLDDINQQLWHLNTAKNPNDNALSASTSNDTEEEDYIAYEDINLSKVCCLERPAEGVSYRYNEGNLLTEIKEYIDSTYDEHYSQDKIQALEVIIDAGHGEGFMLGNSMKYLKRVGKKKGETRKDLLKVIHYGLLMIDLLDKKEQSN